jgi:hypothetical protein
MTEIKYKDTTIPVEAGQTVTLNTADKKLTGDMVICVPKAESGGGAVDTRDVRTVCVHAAASFGYTLTYSTENEPTTNYYMGDDMNAWVNIAKGTKIRLAIKLSNTSYEQYFERAYCEQLGGEIGTAVENNRRYTDWFVVDDNIFDFNIEYASVGGGGGVN